MIKSIYFLTVVLSLLAAGATSGGHQRGCPDVPTTTAEKACSAVCSTRHMHRLCLRTLLRRRSRHAASLVTRYATVAASSALDAYDGTEAAARKAMRGGHVPLPSDEWIAYAGCVEGYEAARRSMSLVADDLARAASSSSCDGAENLRQDYMGGLRGMDACRRSLRGYPASPLSGRNLADRNKTLLAALLCSLVARPPEKRHGVDA
ncbi:unnamed protein product [Alopecurus aequalis]